MEKEQYKNLMTDLNSRVENCKLYFNNLNTTDDVKNITISQAIALREFVTKEYADMTTILMVDLYHIIGMGNMSAVQTNNFIKAIREYLSYRPLLNAFKNKLTTFEDLPVIPVKTTFRTLVLARGTEFVCGEGDNIVEDTCSLEEYDKIRKERSAAAIEASKQKLQDWAKDINVDFITLEESQDNSVISFAESDLSLMKKILAVSPGTKQSNASSLEQKINSGGNYLGFAWMKFAGIIRCQAVSSNAKDLLQQVYLKKQADSNSEQIS